MNREQVICILVGIFILAGMMLCPPVGIAMMSLYWYSGDPNAGMNLMTLYRFMPDSWPRCINYGVFLWQCFFLCVIIFCIVFAFKRDIKKPTHNIKKWKKIFSLVLISASIVLFLLWFVATSLEKVFWFSQLGLLNAGFVGFLATFVTVNIYVDKKQISQFLQAVLISCSILAFCIIASYFRHRYSPNKFQITPNMWRLLGGLAFLGVWVGYLIEQFIRKNKTRRCYEDFQSDI